MRWHEAPLLPLSAALAVGILSGPWAAVAPGWLLAAGGLLLTVGACALALGRDGAATAILLALAVVLGALRGATDPLPPDHIARAALVPVVSVEGRLAEDPVRWAPGRTRLLLDVDSFLDGADRRPASGRLQVTLYGETAAVGEGQRVAVDLKLSRPGGFRNPGAFNYPAFLRREGILLVASGRADSLVPLTPDAPATVPEFPRQPDRCLDHLYSPEQRPLPSKAGMPLDGCRDCRVQRSLRTYD